MKAKLLPPFAGAVVMAVIALVTGARNPYAVLAFAFVGYAAFANLREYWIGMSARHAAHGEGWATALVAPRAAATAGGTAATSPTSAILFVALGDRGVADVSARSAKRRSSPASRSPWPATRCASRKCGVAQEPQRAVIGATMEVVENGERGRPRPTRA